MVWEFLKCVKRLMLVFNNVKGEHLVLEYYHGHEMVHVNSIVNSIRSGNRCSPIKT